MSSYTVWDRQGKGMQALERRRRIEKQIKGLPSWRLLDLTIAARLRRLSTLFEPWPDTRARKIEFLLREVERNFMPVLAAAMAADQQAKKASAGK